MTDQAGGDAQPHGGIQARAGGDGFQGPQGGGDVLGVAGQHVGDDVGRLLAQGIDLGAAIGIRQVIADGP